MIKKEGGFQMRIRKKCIACGYIDDKVEVKRKAKLMYSKFPKDIKDGLKKIFTEINKKIYKGAMPEEYKFRFLYAVNICSHEDIRHGIRVWDAYDYGKQAKTLRYLQAIILGNAEEKEAKMKAEQLMHGSNPPNIDQVEAKSEYEFENRIAKKSMLLKHVKVARRKSPN